MTARIAGVYGNLTTNFYQNRKCVSCQKYDYQVRLLHNIYGVVHPDTGDIVIYINDQLLWKTIKVILRGKIISYSAHINKQVINK